jgi:uncharacterized protein
MVPQEGGTGALTDAASASAAPLAPVREDERVALLDVLRGFALFGILIVNMGFYSSPLYLSFAPIEWWTEPLDVASQALVRFLAQDKFYTLFSILFGVGIAIQSERAESRGVRFGPLFARRMLWLGVIGLIHAFLIWFGDILALYALVGGVAFLFRRRSMRMLLISAGVLLLIPLALSAFVVGIVELAKLDAGLHEAIQTEFAESQREILVALEQARETYSAGSLGEIFGQRARDVAEVYASLPVAAPPVLAMFLVGIAIGRARLLHDPFAFLAFLRPRLALVVLVALLGNAIATAVAQATNPTVPSALRLLGQFAITIGAPALCLAYMYGIAWLVARRSSRSWIMTLAAPGRAALSNYLLQSCVCTAIFNSHGLGLYGRVPPSSGLLLAIAIFAAEIALSGWWLRRFRFGPVEWVWRSLTYRRLQPWRGAG